MKKAVKEEEMTQTIDELANKVERALDMEENIIKNSNDIHQRTADAREVE